jgi:hypothetical protein
MSKEALAKVVQRAISDAGFRRQLNSDPAGALRGFDLTADEASALRTGDAGRLSTLGVDQRMSKSYALGGAVAATRSAQSDLTAGSPASLDDNSGAGSHTVIPADPNNVGNAIASGTEANRSADIDGGNAGARTAHTGDDYKFTDRVAADGSGTGTVRAGDDYKFTDRVSADSGSSVRTGDDWKFADRAAQGSVAPVEGSPEASAADIARGGGMASYPSHDGLAGPSAAQSVRAGDDWSRAGNMDDPGRIGNARLADEPIGAAGGASAIHDDPDGFLAANANTKFADDTGSVVRANVIHDDPDGFLAANANADLSGATSRGDGTAFIDESEAYLSKVGYDPSVTKAEVTDAHDRGTWSGDDIAGPSSDSASSAEGNLADHSDGSSLTP